VGTRDRSRFDLVDHGLRDGNLPWLNECQSAEAADHRKSLLTTDGAANYGKL